MCIRDRVINDADAAALAEARYGSLQDLDCGAALVLGTGVGLGLVSQKDLSLIHIYEVTMLATVLNFIWRIIRSHCFFLHKNGDNTMILW